MSNEMIAIVIRGGKLRGVVSGTKQVDYVIVDFDDQDGNFGELTDFGDLTDQPADVATVTGATSDVDWVFVERAYDAVAAQG